MSQTVLYLDTTTNRLLMGLSQAGEFVVQRNVVCDSHRYHSALMIPTIEEMLRRAGMAVRDLTAVVVNHGPGSFTGIRTGIITVRTMGQFLNLPVHVFNQFELLAFAHKQPVSIYVDALRGRAYHASLSFDATGPVYQTLPTLVTLKPEDTQILSSHSTLVSPGLVTYFPAGLPCQIPEDFYSPASMLALMAQYGDRFVKPWRDVRPLYLQEPSITIKKAQSVS